MSEIIKFNNLVGYSTKIKSTEFKGSQGDMHLSTDWQLSKNSLFSTLVKSLYDTVDYRKAWFIKDLEPGTTYYVRVRHKGIKSGLSPWGNILEFKTKLFFIDTPKLIFPVQNNNEIRNRFYLFSSEYVGAEQLLHTGTTWQFSEKIDFSVIAAEVVNSSTYLTKLYTKDILKANINYFARIKYHSGLYTSDWSEIVTFITKEKYVRTPTIQRAVLSGTSTLVITASEIDKTVELDNVTATWEVSTSPNFSSLRSVSQNGPTSCTMSGYDKTVTYFARVKYIDNLGSPAEWSPVFPIVYSDVADTTAEAMTAAGGSISSKLQAIVEQLIISNTPPVVPDPVVPDPVVDPEVAGP